MPGNIPALHCPIYMQALLDPTIALLEHIADLPMTSSLCEIHSDEILMLKAEKVTSIIHEVYPTESDRLGYYVDNDQFSFEGTNTTKTQKQLKEQKGKILQVARVAGFDLQYEHNLYDAKIKHVVEPNFNANWFQIAARFYEHGPPLIHMPTDIIHSVRSNKVLQLDYSLEQEKEYQLQLDDMTE